MKISLLPAGTTPTGIEVIPAVQGGQTVSLTAAQIAQSTQAALTKTDDTNVTLTLGGTPGSAVLKATSITVGWTGRLALSRLSTGTSGYALIGNGASDASYQGFLQAGTGGTTRTWLAKEQERFSVKDFGATGDGTTNDTAAIQAAFDAAVAAGGGIVFFPRATSFYKTIAKLTINVSALSTRYQGALWLMGEGPSLSLIKNTALADAIIEYTGNTAQVEAYVRVSGLRLLGNNVGSSVGLKVTAAAYVWIDHCTTEGLDFGFDATDIEQASFRDVNLRYNAHGCRFNGASSVTDANSILFDNCTIGNNTTYGALIIHANAVTFVGGSVQYNGTIGGGTGQYGVKLSEAGTGYGTVNFHGVAFEGNGGAGDVVSDQTTNPCAVNFVGNSFLRTDLTTVGYGTNNISITGANANANYRFSGNTFLYGVSYTPNAGRPNVSIANTSARVTIDGNNYFKSATEAPATTSNYLTGGVIASLNSNILDISGASSGYRFGAVMVVGSNSLAPIGTFTTHVAADKNFYCAANFNLADGVAFGSINDANNALKGMEFRASLVMIGASGLSVGTASDPGSGLIYQNSASFLMRTKTSWSTGAGASTGTLTNAPAVGNPTKWIPVDDNGTTRYIPAW